jgi:hypothetical protein
MPRKGSRVWTFSRIEMIGQKRQENLAWACIGLARVFGLTGHGNLDDMSRQQTALAANCRLL